MKPTFCIRILAAAALLGALGCAQEQSVSYDRFEDESLAAWMSLYRPALVNNYQPEGGYYVEVIKPGRSEAPPVRDTACWVRFDFSGRDLSGNIILTRRGREAYQVGTFTRYTRYVPYYRYCGTANGGLMEGTYLALRNVLELDPTYASDNGFDRQLELRPGSQVRLYLPSRVVGSGGVEGDGGYEGQYSLSANRPFIIEMEITGVDKNPLEVEGSEVDAFCELNGGRVQFTKEGADGSEVRPTDPSDAKHPYLRDERWVSVCDTVPQLYVNCRYDPAHTGAGGDPDDRLKFPEPYRSDFEPYNRADLETRIAEALRARFHPDEDEPYKGVAALESDSVGLDGTAKIWYIGRFLDGFIFDTNIDEVKQIIYGEVREEGTVNSYTPEQGGMISAFYYTIPHLRYGQWAELITTSTNAYGSSGKSGGTTTTTSSSGYSASYLDYLNYMNYMQSYYGSSGYYGGYYGSYYGNYLGGYYGNYSDAAGQTTTTTAVYTDIPSFAPLIFQLYIEPLTE